MNHLIPVTEWRNERTLLQISKGIYCGGDRRTPDWLFSKEESDLFDYVQWLAEEIGYESKQQIGKSRAKSALYHLGKDLSDKKFIALIASIIRKIDYTLKTKETFLKKNIKFYYYYCYQSPEFSYIKVVITEALQSFLIQSYPKKEFEQERELLFELFKETDYNKKKREEEMEALIGRCTELFKKENKKETIACEGCNEMFVHKTTCPKYRGRSRVRVRNV